MSLPARRIFHSKSSNRWPFLQLGNPNAPGILFLHGFMGTGDDWLPIALSLKDTYFCILPDLPGHGENTTWKKTHELNFDNLATELAEIARECFPNPPALAGYSLGGRIALFTVCTHPQRFSALCLEGANPGIHSLPERQARLEADKKLARKILEKGMEIFVKEWYRLPLFASLAQKPELLNSVIAKRIENDPYWMAKVIAELSPGLHPPLHDLLAKISIPVHLVAGQLDDKYQEINRELMTQFPNCRLSIIPGAGHNTHIENPAAFIRELKKFLSQTHIHN